MTTNIGDIRAFITADSTDYNRSLDKAALKAQAFSKKTAKAFNQVGQSFTSLGMSLTLGITAPLALLAQQIDATGQSFARMQTRLEFATGSSLEAGKAMGFISSEVERLGTNLTAGIDGFSRFAAAAQGTKLEGQGVLDIFTGVNQAVATLGLSADDARGVFRALEQIMSKGKVQAEELRGQMGERIPGAFQLAARAMGVTTAELNKMLETGKVVSDVFLPRFARELQRTFTKTVPDAVRATNRLSNEFVLMKNTIFTSGLGTIMIDLKNTIADLFRTIRDLSPQAQRFGIIMAGLAAAMGPALFITGKLIIGVGKLISLFGFLVPIIASAIVPLIALVGGVGLLWSAFKDVIDLEGPLNALWNGLVAGWRAVATFFGEVSKFLQDENAKIADNSSINLKIAALAWGFLTTELTLVGIGLKSIAQLALIAAQGLLAVARLTGKAFGADEFVKDIEGAQFKLDQWILGLEASKRASAEMQSAANADWLSMGESMKGTLNTFSASFNALPEKIINTLRQNFPEVFAVLDELMQKAQNFIELGAFDIGPFGLGEGRLIAGLNEFSAAEEAVLVNSKSRWQEWADSVANTMSRWKVSLVNSFTDVAATIVTTLIVEKNAAKALRSTLVSTFTSLAQQMIAIAMKAAAVRMAVAAGVVAAEAAEEAPSVFAIPLFVGIGLAALAAGIARSGSPVSSPAGGGGSGSGSGIDTAIIPQATQSQVVGEPDVADVGALERTQKLVLSFTDEMGNEFMSWVQDQNDLGKGDGVKKFATTGA